MTAEELETDGFVKYLESNKVFVKAFGNIDNKLKMYVYSKAANSGIYFLCELLFDFKEFDLQYTIKTVETVSLASYEEYLLKILEPLL